MINKETIEQCMSDSFEQKHDVMKENLSDNLLLKNE